MKFDATLSFSSDRLKFIIVNDQYVDAIFNELTPTVAKFLPFIPTGKKEDTFGFVAYSLGQLEQQKDITLLATDRNTGEFIGCCGIHDICEESISLGIWLKESASGKGYGTEIIKALEQFVFDQIPVDYLIYNVEKNNHGSIHIAEKLGYSYHSTFIRNISEEKILDMLQYRKVPV
ncbi:GNAT family N-acetyltransferase [Myroides odoratus]|uniref:GNAT family N-acetyltransferase n=1 Tax=Myroides odoratus TaxID=256 RepID=UPI0039B0D63C